MSKMQNLDFSAFGYYDDAGDTPTHDPGVDKPCPVCGGHIPIDKMKTPLFMTIGGRRSWFYRIHAECATDENMQHVESFIVDAMSRLAESAQEVKQ